MGIIILFIDESQYTKIYVFFSNKNFLKMYNLWIFNSKIRHAVMYNTATIE